MLASSVPLLLVGLATAATALQDAAVTSLLQKRGLTRREAESVQHRHRRLSKKPLQLPELEQSLSLLDALDLLPGQTTHLIRSYPLSSFDDADPARHRWCSYKTHSARREFIFSRTRYA